jgi:Ca2+-binding RTX toxin-like protein
MAQFNLVIDLAALNGTDGFRLDGIDVNDNSGASVSSAGDVNGDGYDDIIIGAISGSAAGMFQVGESYVVFGKSTTQDATFDLSTLDGSNGFRLAGIRNFDQCGHSVASAGDVNGDGFSDLIIGAQNAEVNGSPGAGESYVIFGKSSGFGATLDLSTLDGLTGFSLKGSYLVGQSGTSVASAGDINGDGYDDLFIGAGSTKNGTEIHSGESYVVCGQAAGFSASINLSDLDGSTGFRIEGIDSLYYSECAVASAGDVNGDGFSDMVIGANGGHSNGKYSGQSHVVFGKASNFSATFDPSTLDGISGFRIIGANSNVNSRTSVASAGDVNGDGFDDILIGAEGTSPRGVFLAGASYVVFGKASGFTSTLDLSKLNGTNGFRIEGANVEDFSGSSVASAGDVNGDGFDDVIIGARSADPGGDTWAGSSYVVFGKATGFGRSIKLSTVDGNSGFRLDGVNPTDLSGYSVASAGDINNDGFDDLIVGAPSADPGGDSEAGSSYVIFGHRADTAVTITGTALGLTHNGGLGGDIIDGKAGDDVLRGWESTDRLIGGAGADVIDGGEGSDYASYQTATSGVTVDLRDSSGAANTGDAKGDTFISVERFLLSGTSDTFHGSNAAFARNIAYGLDGDDNFRAGGRSGELGAFSSDGTTFEAGQENFFYGGNGNDSFYNGDDLSFLYPFGIYVGVGNSGNMCAYGDAGNDLYLGGRGNDVFFGGAGEDIYWGGGAGQDVARGGDGDDQLSGSGKCTFYGESGNDKLVGGDHGDVFFGGAGIDTLTGNAGDDRLEGGADADTIDGGEGNDYASYQTATNGVTVDLRDSSGAANVGDAKGDTFVSIERFLLSGQNDIFNGSDVGFARNIAYGFDGDDTFYAGGRSIEIGLSASSGNGFQENIFYGGEGNDSFSNSGFSFSFVDAVDDRNLFLHYIEGLTGNMRAYGDAGSDSYVGGFGNDVFFGGAGEDRYWGGLSGEDIAYGGEGNDELISANHSTLYGENGNDTLTGGFGSDAMYGGVGNDRLIGGSGKDWLYGGTGADTFVFNNTDTGADRIYDFELGVDKLEFSGLTHGIDDLTISLSGGEIRILIEPSNTIFRINNLHTATDVVAIVNDIVFV